MELLGEYPGVFNVHLLPDVLLVNWYGLSTLQSTPEFETICAQCSKRFAQQPLSCVQLLTARISRLPDSDTRDELTRINQTYDSMIACCAVLIPIQGFVGSAVRGLVTAMSLKTRRTHANLKIVGTPETAVEWLVPAHHAATDRELDPQPLLAALHQLSTQH
jgi:hypothetical protein